MAFVRSHYSVELRFVDFTGASTTIEIWLVGADEATARANATALRALYIAVSAGSLVEENFKENFYEDNPTLGGGSVEAKVDAYITGNLVDLTKKGHLSIPAPKQDVVFVAATGPNANVVDVAQADVNDFLAAFVSAAPLAYVSDGENFNDNSPNFRGLKRAGGKQVRNA